MDGHDRILGPEDYAAVSQDLRRAFQDLGAVGFDAANREVAQALQDIDVAVGDTGEALKLVAYDVGGPELQEAVTQHLGPDTPNDTTPDKLRRCANAASFLLMADPHALDNMAERIDEVTAARFAIEEAELKKQTGPRGVAKAVLHNIKTGDWLRLYP